MALLMGYSVEILFALLEKARSHVLQRADKLKTFGIIQVHSRGSYMPGAYAHITVVNHAQKQARHVLKTNDAKFALARHLPYLELGAVSPDYPYLAMGQAEWADHMHYTNTASLLRQGVRHLMAIDKADRPRATSWLFGFAAHMTADMTIHPIVEKIVGSYAENKAEHRRCEMHQDALIFQKLDLGDVGLTKHMKTGIASCGDPKDEDKLDPVIARLWLQILGDAYADVEKKAEPNPDKWHNGFVNVLEGVTIANRLFPFARHVAAGANLTYPETDALDHRFTHNLWTPEGELSYEQIFDRAQANVLSVWGGLEAAMNGDNSYLDGLKNWNLDTGKTVPGDRFVFWKAVA
jgi:hypothetical protein